MSVGDLSDWMDEYGRPGYVWYAKRLSGNDTLANGSHQAGPYIPRELLFEIAPQTNTPDVHNPDVSLEIYVDSHADVRTIRGVWYNGKFHGGTRNEARLTGFGGKNSILLDPDSTGALAVFVFSPATGDTPLTCHAWLCEGEGTEADLVEERLGPVEPKMPVIWHPGAGEPHADLFGLAPTTRSTCWLGPRDIPPAWLVSFPTGRQIIEKTISMRRAGSLDADRRLMRRRMCEFEIFRSVEEATWMPRIEEGFDGIDSFLGLANTILQSRKSRAGKSLEYHTIAILEEEGFVAGTTYAHNPSIEGGKRPDFLFPHVPAYEDMSFPANRLRMLAAKTTCRDRWRQVLNEADRIPVKHLLTLQEGISVTQFREMTEAGVRLVVPAGLHRSYHEDVRPHLLTLEGFIGDLRVV